MAGIGAVVNHSSAMAAFLVAGGVDCFLLLLRAPAQRPDTSLTIEIA
jgi:hypothetical protein